MDDAPQRDEQRRRQRRPRRGRKPLRLDPLDGVVARAFAGDAVAREELFAFASNWLERCFRGWLSTRQRLLIDPEELAQETALVLLKAWGRFRGRHGGASFRRWLRENARGRLLSWWRSVRCQKRAISRTSSLSRGGGEDGEAPLDIADGSPRPDDAAQARESVERLKAALPLLAERSRQALALSYGQGLPHAAIAKVLGTTEDNVNNILFRARRELGRHLGSEDQGA